MKSSFILLSTIALFSLSLASVVAPNGSKQVVYPQPPDNCELPSLVSYCLEMMKIGSFYDKEDAGTPTLAELQADVAEVPMGACSWVEYTGTATVQDCMQALEDYVGKDYDGVDNDGVDNDAVDNDAEDNDAVDDEDEQDGDDITTTYRGLFKKLKKAIKKGAKKVKKAVKKGAKKVKNAIKKGAKKIGKGLTKAGKGVVKGAKKAGKGVVKGTKKAVRKVAKFCKKNQKFCEKVADLGLKIIKGENVVGKQDPNQSQSQF